MTKGISHEDIPDIIHDDLGEIMQAIERIQPEVKGAVIVTYMRDADGDDMLGSTITVLPDNRPLRDRITLCATLLRTAAEDLEEEL